MIEAGLDNIDQAMTIFDQDLKLIYANSKCHDLLGLPPELMVPGTYLGDIFRYNALAGEYGVGEIEELIKVRIEAAMRFEVHTVERQRPNGVYLRVSGQPLPLSIGGFATIYTDISEQRQRELKQEMLIAERTRELRLSEERLRLISNEVPAGIAYLDEKMVFQFANIRFARSYERTPEDMVGKTAEELLAPATYRTARSHFDKAIAGQKSDFGMQISLMDGRERYIQTYLHPDFRRDGSTRGFYVLSINITRQRQSEAALSQAQKMEAVGRLSSGIAHDFNNLLTIIMGNLRPLSEQIDDPILIADMIEPALRAAQRGAGLTEQLLAFARRQPLSPKITEVNKAIQSVARLMRSTLPENIDFICTEPEEKIYSFIDHSQFESSLLNLVLNAQQAITKTGRIEISLNVIDDKASIQISDNGMGMDAALVEKIFDPFFTTKESQGGTGLGLSMTQSFIEQSKGHLTVKSVPGKGTDVTILLPSVANELADSETKEHDQKLELKTPQIALLVDDEEEVRHVLRRDLITLGYGVLESENADNALKLLESVEGISLVLSDIAMPGELSGYDISNTVYDRYPDISVILMTGHADVSPADALCSDNVQILRKPFGLTKLTNAISAAISSRL
ncbi:MAG: PAS-domain containing protein [Proteobacteria bacterium]|nr:PAS-domain containing protein [Pseudomonadota bacterium]